jgi:hypothetical protein
MKTIFLSIVNEIYCSYLTLFNNNYFLCEVHLQSQRILLLNFI